MKGGFPKHLSGWHRPIQKSVFEHAEAHIAVDKILKKPMKLVKNLSLKIMSEVVYVEPLNSTTNSHGADLAFDCAQDLLFKGLA